MDEWKHIVVTYDYGGSILLSTDPKIYLDGVRITSHLAYYKAQLSKGTYTPPATAASSDIGVTISSWLIVNSKASMDDMRVYNRVLSAEEVEALYTAVPPRAAYYYNFSNDAQQWCDGVNAPINMGPELSTTGPGCGNQNNTSKARMAYNTSINSYLYCNSEYDVPIGRNCASGYCGGDSAHKIVFTLDNRLFQSNFSGVSGADTLCQNQADQAGLSGTYYAWIADSNATSEPAQRFSAQIRGSLPIYKTNGAKVADDWTDLTDGTLDSTINITAFGTATVEGGFDVFSNVDTDGTQLGTTNTCSDYTSGTGNFERGRKDLSNSNWTNAGTTACSGGQALLYCFEQ